MVAEPTELPPPDEVDVVIVDWNDRRPLWGEQLRRWRDSAGAAPPRLVLFGSHVDLDGHAEAKRHGIGPVMARSRFVERLPLLIGGRP